MISIPLASNISQLFTFEKGCGFLSGFLRFSAEINGKKITGVDWA
jgi:hypothetical protein